MNVPDVSKTTSSSKLSDIATVVFVSAVIVYVVVELKFRVIGVVCLA